LLGNDILVAPVLHQGQRTRNIYLPPGTWRDHWTDRISVGLLEIQEYPAPIELLPIFHRICP
jgi:alpha-glucosidase (family GH31 glycosyl hydrolase)